MIAERCGLQPADYLDGFVSVKGYMLENASEQLQASFEQIEPQRYDVKRLIDYILSFPIALSPERLEALQTYVEAAISHNGQLQITKDMDVVIAR